MQYESHLKVLYSTQRCQATPCFAAHESEAHGANPSGPPAQPAVLPASVPLFVTLGPLRDGASLRLRLDSTFAGPSA